MAATTSSAGTPTAERQPGGLGAAWLAVRAAARCGIFVLEMVPTRRQPVDWITRAPLIERLPVATRDGSVDADVYRPSSPGPHPGVVVSFGVNPGDAMDPRVAQMGNALARAGFAALLFWPPSARDLTIEPDDVADLGAAFQALRSQPYVRPAQCGFAGICVGGATALIAAADPALRHHVSFVCAYAPYSSMRTLAVDIASGLRTLGDVREPWDVDPLTWRVYVRTVTGWLRPDEAQRLRDAFEGCITWNEAKTAVRRAPAGPVEPADLSASGRAALRVLGAGAGDIEAAIDALPAAAQSLLTTLSPLHYVDDLRANVILLHDRDDHVIPVGESRRLWAAVAARSGGTYTELGLRHLRMPQGASPLRIVRELAKSYLGWYPMFRAVTG